MTWWRRIGSWMVGLTWQLLVPVANFLVATMIAAVAAVLALVVEDLLPLTGPRECCAARGCALVMTRVGLCAGILWRGTVYRLTGTLFYLRMLDHSMVDWHATALKLAHRRRMSLRSVTPTPRRYINFLGECYGAGVSFTDTAGLRPRPWQLIERWRRSRAR